jgi:multicomponent Na+:H+ antiporter subunit B
VIRRFVAVALLAAFALLLWQLISVGTPDKLGSVSQHYVRDGIIDDRASNLVTSVVVNYRGLDTLGEVTVLFLAATGVAFVLRRRNRRGPETRHAESGDAESQPASEIVLTGSRVLFGPIIAFGAYIFVHGHLTPGGGFQGGAVVASGVLLLFLADRDRELPHRVLSWLESFSGFGFVLVGLAGLLFAGSFLANRSLLPLGRWNALFSAGVIPIIYVLIGLKVGTELSALLDVMIHGGRAIHGEEA